MSGVHASAISGAFILWQYPCPDPDLLPCQFDLFPDKQMDRSGNKLNEPAYLQSLPQVQSLIQAAQFPSHPCQGKQSLH